MKAQLGLISIKYTFDTNVFGDFWDLADPYRAYPIDIKSHREAWEFIETMIGAGEIVASCEVREQLLKSELPELKQWIKTHEYMFLELEAIPALEVHLQAIVDAFPDYANTKNDPVDAIVVATAKGLGSVVVSSEKRIQNQGVLLKVPNVCDALGVECMSINEFLRAEGYV